jgi:hypothetical protein
LIHNQFDCDFDFFFASPFVNFTHFACILCVQRFLLMTPVQTSPPSFCVSVLYCRFMLLVLHQLLTHFACISLCSAPSPEYSSFFVYVFVRTVGSCLWFHQLLTHFASPCLAAASLATPIVALSPSESVPFSSKDDNPIDKLDQVYNYPITASHDLNHNLAGADAFFVQREGSVIIINILQLTVSTHKTIKSLDAVNNFIKRLDGLATSIDVSWVFVVPPAAYTAFKGPNPAIISFKRQDVRYLDRQNGLSVWQVSALTLMLSFFNLCMIYLSCRSAHRSLVCSDSTRSKFATVEAGDGALIIKVLVVMQASAQQYVLAICPGPASSASPRQRKGCLFCLHVANFCFFSIRSGIST